MALEIVHDCWLKGKNALTLKEICAAHVFSKPQKHAGNTILMFPMILQSTLVTCVLHSLGGNTLTELKKIK